MPKASAIAAADRAAHTGKNAFEKASLWGLAGLAVGGAALARDTGIVHSAANGSENLEPLGLLPNMAFYG